MKTGTSAADAAKNLKRIGAALREVESPVAPPRGLRALFAPLVRLLQRRR